MIIDREQDSRAENRTDCQKSRLSLKGWFRP
jgi:hypothetical protein